ncbi:MAG: archaellin/type IV pilin N-terminal domain-containing protein [Thermoproteota archaeon]
MRSKTRNKRSIRTLLKDKRGISPVITTVILVAVGIALAVAIGLWMSGLVSTFTRFEKLEVTSAYAIATGSGWNVYVTVKNTGSADATITSVLINGIPNSNSSSWNSATLNPPLPVTINVGSDETFNIFLPKGGTIGSTTLTSGITLNIVLHSAAGKDYPSSVTLP